MADENRVFDVAKPGSSKPETGSKPMVVGHKMMKDTTLKATEDNKTEEPQKIQQTVGKTIKPLEADTSDELDNKDTNSKSETESSETEISKNEQPEAETEVTSESNDIKSEEVSNPEPKPETEVVNKVETKEKSLQENGIELEENLQKIIKEKTYNVHIEEASALAFKTFIKTFIIVAIIGLVILIVLIDSDIIDLGITLPFDFL